MATIEDYRQALKKRVCGICLDRRDDGSCGLPEGRTCALDLHLPLILQAVEAVHSDRIEDYARSIQETVCVQCPNQNVAGYCHFRQSWNCALDTFVYMVVEAIEEIKGREGVESLRPPVAIPGPVH